MTSHCKHKCNYSSNRNKTKLNKTKLNNFCGRRRCSGGLGGSADGGSAFEGSGLPPQRPVCFLVSVISVMRVQNGRKRRKHAKAPKSVPKRSKRLKRSKKLDFVKVGEAQRRFFGGMCGAAITLITLTISVIGTLVNGASK